MNKTSNPLQGHLKSRKSKPVCLGFHFSAQENRAIEAAKKKSMAFMLSYGRGRSPFMIDIRNYIN